MVRLLFLVGLLSLAACVAAEEPAVWAAEDCEKVSGASGYFLYEAGQELEKGVALTEADDPVAAEDAFESARYLSELAVNFARNYETYCQS
ncbi:MAG: hypothetical protein ACPG07_02890 [Henriciella sp.]